jgi:hypothetical protein
MLAMTTHPTWVGEESVSYAVVANGVHGLSAGFPSPRARLLRLDAIELARFDGPPTDGLRDLPPHLPSSVGFWLILLKKSVNAVAPIFSASLVRFLNRDAEDLIGRRRSDMSRSKWNCEAINSRF